MKYGNATLGQIEAVWNKLGGDEGVLKFLRDETEVVTKNRDFINCDEISFIPDGWSVLPESEQLSNRVRGLYKLDITKVKLHLYEEQKEGRIKGSELRKKLKEELVLPVNVLDFLLKKENQHLIPEEWKGKYVFFWGTIYRDSDGDLYVRYLYWHGDGWSWSCNWLGSDWVGRSPSAVSAS